MENASRNDAIKNLGHIKMAMTIWIMLQLGYSSAKFLLASRYVLNSSLTSNYLCIWLTLHSVAWLKQTYL
jgi:hypothetical protein